MIFAIGVMMIITSAFGFIGFGVAATGDWPSHFHMVVSLIVTTLYLASGVYLVCI